MKTNKTIITCLVALLTTTMAKAEDYLWDFEDGLEGWSIIDANKDGYSWTLTSAIPTIWPAYSGLNLDWYHTGKNAVCSGSYINGVGALSPDEYLVSPQFTPVAGSTISFWAAATDASFSADHFGVAVSTTTPTPGAFKMLNEWTMTPSRDFTGGRQGAPRRIGAWHKYTVNLSNYSGEKIYVAIRHFNCVDQYIIVVDNIEITQVQEGGESGKTVGIDDNDNENEKGNWKHGVYDLQGRRLHGVPATKGVFISNGKKVVMK